ncbi:MAG: tripartite tricarboxylate transporter substrate binding protein [Betaproteobacteria bacterium]|nr:tripartite tricarboxylate transporter substrate binding protein [Betaproteobacteria bacterium]
MTIKSRRAWLGAAAAVSTLGSLALCSPAAHAQASYPDKPIRMVIAFPPGGPTDLVARVLAQKLAEQMGQSVVVDNKPGANGNIAAELVAKAPADGYTLFYNTSAVALSPALYKKLGYDVRADFAPVALTAVIPLVLAVHPSVPANSVAEFIAHLKANPGKLSYGSAGNGNITHLGAYLMLQSQGLTAVHVPYKGSAPALTDAVAGQTQFLTDTINSALPFIREKRLRALAVTSLQRSPVLPEVPTLNESGLRGFEVGAWQGLMVPARTPVDIVNRLNTEVMKALASADVRARLAAQGASPLGSTPAEYASYLRDELQRWDRVVKATGATLE